ncbi:uncharacterized protein LOC144920752 [Branchiostoma floridae x Branchiostoma belcheri]
MDACLANPCHTKATCTDNPAPGLDATCTYINACLTNLCHAKATCTDNPAPGLDATCTCKTGYTGDGFVSGTGCSDIDACLTNPCHTKATCTDNPAPGLDATCTCKTGYTGDGLVSETGCSDIDACLTNPCHAKATCTDNPAPGLDATCACKTGYTGDGLVSGTGCSDIDACLANPCHTKATCTDNPAPGLDATCTCKAGYTGDGLVSGTGCSDIDACLANPCHTKATCTDNPAPGLDATCACKTGYTGDGFVSGTGCSDCHFPFTYKGKTYSSCTNDNHDAPWCSFTAYYQGKWKNCDLDDLKHHASGTGCLDGYVYHEPSRLCYNAYNNETTYNGAVSRCSSDGGSLAMPRDTATNNFLIYLKNVVDKNARFRIGLTDDQQEGVWMWDDNVPLGDFTAWGPGEPNNYVHEDCAEYNPGSWSPSNTWNDGFCTFDNRKFICQVSPSGQWLERDSSWVLDSACTPWVDGNGVTYDAAKAFDGNIGTHWNPIGNGAGERYYNNWYIVLDLTASHTLTRIAVNNYGDIGHDTAAFTLQKSQVGSPYAWADVVSVDNVIGGTRQRQEFGNFRGTARYWRFVVTRTHSGWQPWLPELDLFGISRGKGKHHYLHEKWRYCF